MDDSDSDVNESDANNQQFVFSEVKSPKNDALHQNLLYVAQRKIRI